MGKGGEGQNRVQIIILRTYAPLFVNPTLAPSTQRIESRMSSDIQSEFGDPNTFTNPFSNVIDPVLSIDTSGSSVSNTSTSIFRRPANSKTQTSWIWEHAVKPEISKHLLRSDGKEIWRCKHCRGTPAEYRISGGTAAPMKHLRLKHGITENEDKSRVVKRARREDMDIREGMARAAEVSAVTRMQKSQDLLQSSVEPSIVRQLFIRWIIKQSLPLSVVECHEFRTFYKYSNPAANSALPRTHQTIRKWIIDVYNIEKDRVRHRLHAAISSIHFSCDFMDVT